MSHDDVLLEKIANHYLFYGSFYSEDITDNISFSQLCEIGWGILYLLQQGFVEGNADEVLEIIDERIELQHSEYMNIMEHYLRFRGTLKEKVA